MSNSNFNVPNVLTVLRLLMIPAVIWLIFTKELIWALVIYLAACITDLVDGYIARKYKLITKLGMWLDPLADKCMAVAALLSLTFIGCVPAIVTAVVLLKEVLMLIGGAIVIKKKYATPSDRWGKIAQFVLNTAICSCFLYDYLAPYCTWATYLALVGVVAAFVHYAIKNFWMITAPPLKETTEDTDVEEEE